jgi:hypothetical protein
MYLHFDGPIATLMGMGLVGLGILRIIQWCI